MIHVKQCGVALLLAGCTVVRETVVQPTPPDIYRQIMARSIELCMFEPDYLVVTRLVSTFVLGTDPLEITARAVCDAATRRGRGRVVRGILLRGRFVL